MNDKTTTVFIGWLELTESERAEFDKAVRDFTSSSKIQQIETRQKYRRRMNELYTGPVGNPCSCCGRS